MDDAVPSIGLFHAGAAGQNDADRHHLRSMALVAPAPQAGTLLTGA